MPDRIIRVGILTSEAVNSLSWSGEVFYRRLMSVVDDFGRYDGRPAVLRASLYALKIDRVSEPDIGKWIRECEEAALVRTYTVGEKPYLEVLKFDQKVRAVKSKWPNPPSVAGNCQQTTADASVVEVEDEGDTVRARAESLGFARFWAAWPPGERKQAKGECAKKWRQKGCEAEVDAILAHVEAMKSSSDWQQGFVPAPLVYLNQRRWQGANVAPKVRRVAL